MAAKKCNADRLAQRVTVFVTDFIRSTYGFLTPTHVDQLRSLKNEVEDNYPSYSVIPTPWQTDSEDKKQSANASTDSESEQILPARKRIRLLSDSTLEKESQSMYRIFHLHRPLSHSQLLPKKGQTPNGLEAKMRTRNLMIQNRVLE